MIMTLLSTIAVLVLTSPLVGGKALRSLNHRREVGGIQLSEVHKNAVSTHSVVGSFPSNPQYGAIAFYSDSSCSGQTATTSFLLNTCMTNGTTSVMYSCAGSDLMTTEYSDTACSTVSSTSSASSFCTAYSSDWASSTKVTTCGTSSPFSSTGNDYSAKVDYVDSSCGNQIMRVISYTNGYCFYFGSGFSYIFDWPNQKLYTASTCASSTLAATFVLDQTCSFNDDDDQSPEEYQAYSKWVGANDAVHSMQFSLGLQVTLIGVLFTWLWK